MKTWIDLIFDSNQAFPSKLLEKCVRELGANKGLMHNLREWNCGMEQCHGCQMAISKFLDCKCLALWASTLWLRYATLQNLIPSFPRIASPPHPPPWRNPRKGRDQILPSSNLAWSSVACEHNHIISYFSGFHSNSPTTSAATAAALSPSFSVRPSALSKSLMLRYAFLDFAAAAAISGAGGATTTKTELLASADVDRRQRSSCLYTRDRLLGSRMI